MSRKLKYHVVLTPDERSKIKSMLKYRKLSKTMTKHCRVLLDLDESQTHFCTHNQASAIYDLTAATVSNLTRDFCEKGLDYVLQPHRSYGQNHARQKVTPHDAAVITEIACENPPQGHAHMSLKMIASEFGKRGILMEDGTTKTISPETVRRTLKKTN